MSQSWWKTDINSVIISYRNAIHNGIIKLIKIRFTEKFAFLMKSVAEQEIDSFCCAIFK